jgi:DNA-binding NarL/FixJ family response regulator
MRILLCDQYTQSRWALETVLGEKDEFDLVGVVEDAQSLNAFGENHTADLYLIDRELPGSPIDEIIFSLHALVPRPFVIVMSSASEYSGMMLKAGADAFVSKSDQPDWLIETLHKFEKKMRNEDK